MRGTGHPAGTGTRGQPAVEDPQTLVSFDGPRVLDSAGVLLAELADDGHWYTSDGARCTGLTLPAARARPRVSKSEKDAARRVADRVWMDGAH